MNKREITIGSILKAAHWSNDITKDDFAVITVTSISDARYEGTWVDSIVEDVIGSDKSAIGYKFHGMASEPDEGLPGAERMEWKGTFIPSFVEGLLLTDSVLERIGFVDSDLKGWMKMYYFGDMRLYYRYSYKDGYAHHASFRFKSVHTKGYVRISCQYVHQLQNIMRFLTGGELEFTYKALCGKGSDDE